MSGITAIFQEILSDDDIFVLGVEGIITDDICHSALKVNFFFIQYVHKNVFKS